MRRFGAFLFTEKIQQLIDILDEGLFLEGDRFEDAFRRKQTAFRESPSREAFLADKSSVVTFASMPSID
jgi:hypothetical protein